MKKSLLLFGILSGLTALLHFLELENVAVIPVEVLTTLRYLCIAVLLVHGFQRKSVTGWILIFLVAGFEFGYDFPTYAVQLKILSEIFLHLIKTIIAPLLFGTLVSGIAGHANLKQVGRMGIKSIIYFELITTFALLIGLVAINISKAGVGVPLPQNMVPEALPKPQNAHDIILHIFPENIAKSIAEGQVLQIVVFSIIFGIGLSMVSERKKKPVLEFCEGLGEVMFKFTNIVMYFAPFAVFGAISFTVATFGIEVFSNLLKLLLTLYAALAAFILLILFPVMLIARISIKKFFNAVSEPVTVAFATASSESALPIAMENMEAFGVPRKIVAFVLPTGYSFNLDGTTLYLSLASIFVAQAAGIHLEIGQQIIMLLTLMLTSKGVAGVPRASMVVLSATVASFG
ncbi:MAG: cation:dicarboxylase symporter family transporter, partial [Chitinophagales bacterium]|nr:cation:dicarboxylase symporter family transporter [Chitinophagales bacterium]